MSSKASATLRYTALRIGVFAGCFLVIWGLVALGWLPSGLGSSNFLWVLVLAIVVSAPLSFVLLRGQRDAMSEQIAPGIDRAREKARSKLAANRSMEDDEIDAAERSRAQTRSTGSEAQGSASAS